MHALMAVSEPARSFPRTFSQRWEISQAWEGPWEEKRPGMGPWEGPGKKGCSSECLSYLILVRKNGMPAGVVSKFVVVCPGMLLGQLPERMWQSLSYMLLSFFLIAGRGTNQLLWFLMKFR